MSPYELRQDDSGPDKLTFMRAKPRGEIALGIYEVSTKALGSKQEVRPTDGVDARP